MTLVSSKEFVSHQKRYFDLAVNEDLFIKNGKHIFHLVYTMDDDIIVDEVDNDEYVTKNELLAGIYEDINKFYASK